MKTKITLPKQLIEQVSQVDYLRCALIREHQKDLVNILVKFLAIQGTVGWILIGKTKEKSLLEFIKLWLF